MRDAQKNGVIPKMMQAINKISTPAKNLRGYWALFKQSTAQKDKVVGQI